LVVPLNGSDCSTGISQDFDNPFCPLTDIPDQTLVTWRSTIGSILLIRTNDALVASDLEVMITGRQATFSAVSLSDAAKTSDLVQQRGFAFPVAMDKDRKAREAFGIMSVPALFIIDENGFLHRRRFGKASLQEDEELIRSFLGEPTR